jgi:magnesium transporter
MTEPAAPTIDDAPNDRPLETIQEADVEDIVDFDDGDIFDLSRALGKDRHQRAAQLLADLTPQDTAEFIEKVDPLTRQKLLTHHGDTLDPEAFTFLQRDILADILEEMSPRKVADIINHVDSDDALTLTQSLSDEHRAETIRLLSAKTRVAIEEGLSFPEQSAGRLMQREFVAIPQFWTVGKTLDYLRAAAGELPDTFLDLFIITPSHHIVGKIPLARLVTAGRSAKVETLSLEDTFSIPANMDQEEVALLFKREDLTSAPVVDDDGRLLGVVTVDDIVHVIADEAEEDILKIHGVKDGDFYRDIKTTAGSRFRWLFVNLFTAVLASWVISFFEATIEQLVALAVLMPIVASMGGNAGTQTLTVAVRALATHELSSTNMWRVIGKETIIGAINGAGFAVITGVVAALWFANPILGLVIGAAMVINLVVAGFMGAMIPVALDKLGQDPAESSTVVLTTFTDVVGFFAFLGLAALFMV